jgi:hypothetical protein
LNTTHRLEGRRDFVEQLVAGVSDEAGAAVDRLRCEPDPGAGAQTQALVAEADAEQRCRSLGDGPVADPEVPGHAGVSGAGRYEDAVERAGRRCLLHPGDPVGVVVRHDDRQFPLAVAREWTRL